MPITESDLAGLRDGNVVSASGDKIGSIGQIYLDDQTGEPTFVTANTGLFGLKQSFVPLQGARVEGEDLVVDYDKETVKDAPRIDDDGSLSPEEEDELYAYYGLGGAGTTTDGYDTRTTGTTGETGTTTDAGYTGTLGSDSRTTTGADYDTRTTTGADYDTGTAAGDVTADQRADLTDRDVDRGTVGSDDDAMTRSEERLNVGTEAREAGRARLRKYVTTENVTQTVPVQREEVRLEREPITDDNVGDATSGPAFTESEHEVTLREERPVVEKEAVPVERVRMTTDTVTEDATVSEDVRKEEIDSDIDVDRPNRRDS
jgi:uncharacterized protein (TIGR02271 family)